MSNTLSEVDRELLGEVPYEDGAETTMTMVTGGLGHEAQEGSHGITFTPLNAAAGTLVKMSSSGDEIEPTNDINLGNTTLAPKTPKKRSATAAANDDSTQPAKKRSPKKKATTATKVEVNTNGEADEPTTTPKTHASPKSKNSADANAETEDGETNGETEGLEPVTPKKGKRAAKGKAINADNDATGGSTEASVSPIKGSGERDGMTVHNTPRKRQAPKKELAAPRGIPSSWENADAADRMMVMMKEKGEGWTEIRAAWKEVTGQDTAASTLPNRYNRIKVNMMRMKDGDLQHLLAAKKEIEDAYNANFWANVATNMERRGTGKYPSAFLQKTFRELEAAPTTAPATGAKEPKDGAAVKEEDAGDSDGA